MLQPTSRRLERILLMGPWGAGKSWSWVRLAYWLQKTQSPAKIHLLDTDHAYLAQCDAFPGFDDVVLQYETNSWEDYNKNTEKALKLCVRGVDWLVVDRADTPWRIAQNVFTEKAFGKDLATFFVEAKKEQVDSNAKPGYAMDNPYGERWGYINKLYDSWMMDRVLTWPGHMIWCTDVKGLGDREPETLKRAFERYGVRPTGQPLLGLQALTVLNMMPKGDGWAYSSCKDLHRERPQNQDINDWVLDYLIRVAKWKLA